MTSDPVEGERGDEELVSACVGGDAGAFGVLVVRHQKAMLNLAYRITGNLEDAAEVTQDAFLAAHRALGTFRGEARFTTWLTTITLNQARNHLAGAARKRQQNTCSLDAPLPCGNPRPEPAAAAPTPLEHLETQVLRRQVETCLQTLAPEFREVLVLRDFQDHEYDAIGSLLSLREGTVKSRLFRARETIKACLKRALGVP